MFRDYLLFRIPIPHGRLFCSTFASLASSTNPVTLTNCIRVDTETSNEVHTNGCAPW
ncbi:hypothetical protein BDZ89DRAFT_1066530 [Hymenopellis radicata]|nr:hypothetical protein BDZ89DRAFT_1066530 [Hymenopellis radicata]